MKFLIFLYYFIFIVILRNFFLSLTNIFPKEFFFLILISSLLICMILSSFNIFFLFLCLEALTLVSIVLISILGQNFSSLEALLNYFFISAFSSVLFLLGTSLIFSDFNLNFSFNLFRLGLNDKIFLPLFEEKNNVLGNFYIPLNYFTDKDVIDSFYLKEKIDLSYLLKHNLDFFFEFNFIYHSNFIYIENLFCTKNLELLVIIGTFFIFVFFLIKLGLFPFHF